MSYPNKQIGWSQEAILLQGISKELDRLAGLIGSGGGGGGATNLVFTATAGGGTITSSTGSPATITLVTASLAGLMSPGDFTKLAGVPTTFVTETSTNTLTNKEIVKRVVTVAYAASMTPNIDTTDVFRVNPVTGALALAVPSGTKVDGQMLLIHLLGDATPRALTWAVTAGGYVGTLEAGLPATTVVNKWIKILVMYNVTLDRWECLSVTNSL